MLKFGRVIECSQWRLFFFGKLKSGNWSVDFGGNCFKFYFQLAVCSYWHFAHLMDSIPKMSTERGPLSLGNPTHETLPRRIVMQVDIHAWRLLGLGMPRATEHFFGGTVDGSKSPAFTLRLVVYPSYLQGFTTIQTVVWPWDFWTINSTNVGGFWGGQERCSPRYLRFSFLVPYTKVFEN